MHVSKGLFTKKIFRGEKYYKNIFTYGVSMYVIKKKKGYESIL